MAGYEQRKYFSDSFLEVDGASALFYLTSFYNIEVWPIYERLYNVQHRRVVAKTFFPRLMGKRRECDLSLIVQVRGGGGYLFISTASVPPSSFPLSPPSFYACRHTSHICSHIYERPVNGSVNSSSSSVIVLQS